MSIEEACNILCKRRRDILEAAHKYITNQHKDLLNDIVKIHNSIENAEINN